MTIMGSTMEFLAEGTLSRFDTVDLVMLALAIVGITILMRGTFRRVTRVTSTPRIAARSKFAAMEKERKAQHDMEQVMIELDHLSRQIQGQLDTKFAKLETIIRDADNRIEKLARLIRTSDGSDTLDIIVQDDCATRGPAEQGDRPRHAAVYRLADAGLSVVEIAQESGKTTGEIELILALRRTKQRAIAGSGRPTVGERP